MSFGSILQGLRKEAKVTQEDLAQNLGVSAQAVSKWENGSYPEGDLIPRIADFFHMPIDYLYGRAEKDMGIEQRVVRELNRLWESLRESGADADSASRAFIDKIHGILWAFQIGAWVENSDYWPLPDGGDGSSRMASTYACNHGFTYMSLAKDREFYVFQKQPGGEGFGRYLEESDDIRALFRFLSDKANTALLKYLYGLKGGEYVRRDTLVKALGVSGEKIDKALEYLMSIRGNHRNDPVVSISVVNEGGQAETAYGINMTQGGLLFSLLAVADEYVHAPCGYKNQIMNREKPWA